MGDGRYEAVTESGQSGVRMQFNDPNAGGYLYFMVDDGFYFNQHQKIEVNVTYLMKDTDRSHWNMIRRIVPVIGILDAMFCTRRDYSTWQYKRPGKLQLLYLVTPTFVGHENGGADFRLGANNGQPALISSVQITKYRNNK